METNQSASSNNSISTVEFEPKTKVALNGNTTFLNFVIIVSTLDPYFKCSFITICTN